jgi:phosphate transport system substrate-binding protein
MTMRVGLGLCVALLVSGCGAADQTPAPVYLRAAGSTSWLPLMTDLAAAYHGQRAHVAIEVSGGGTALGRDLVEAGQVDIGMISWSSGELPAGLQSTTVAHDAIALIVHPTNPITGLTLIQARDVFGGRFENWQQLGGASLPVQVISREDGSGTRAAFEAMAMQGRRITPTALVMPGSEAVVAHVAGDPQAIGYVSAGYVDDRVKSLDLEGLLPTPDNAANGAYVLTRDLALLTPTDASPELEDFLDFGLSPTGQAVVGRRHGRVN